MSNDKTNHRETLLRAAGLVRPALATTAFIPILTHISFDGDCATAYNDINAISVRVKTDLARCLPGDLLIRALNSFNSESILFQEGKDGHLVLKSGRGQVKLPTLENKGFPYQVPDVEGKSVPSIRLDAQILKGIDRCLLSVGNDPTHPAQMGITLDVDKDGNAVLFSTDNFTISRFQTQAKIALPADAPVIMPRFFCEQLIALNKAFADEAITLYFWGSALFAQFGGAAELFTKTPVDVEPLDFRKIVTKHVKLDGLKKQMAPIPDAWDSAFTRALLVLGAEDDKATKISIGVDTMDLESTSAAGVAEDRLAYEPYDSDPEEAFYVNPQLVVRASKHCALLGFTKTTVLLADSDLRFLHIIAHSAAK